MDLVEYVVGNMELFAIQYVFLVMFPLICYFHFYSERNIGHSGFGLDLILSALVIRSFIVG